MANKLHDKISGYAQKLEQFADCVWVPPLIGLLALIKIYTLPDFQRVGFTDHDHLATCFWPRACCIKCHEYTNSGFGFHPVPLFRYGPGQFL